MIKKILIFILVLGMLSSTASVDSHDDSSKFNENVQPYGKQFSLNLNDKIGIEESVPAQKKPKNELPITEKPNISNVISIHLIDDIRVLSSNLDNETISNVKHNSEMRAILERILKNDVKKNGLTKTYNHISIKDLDESNSQNVAISSDLIYDVIPNILASNFVSADNLISIFDVSEANYTEIPKPPSKSASTLNDFDEQIFLLILGPFALFIIIRNENIKFYNFTKLFCYLFVVILLSSGVITPLSISSLYWPPI